MNKTLNRIRKEETKPSKDGATNDNSSNIDPSSRILGTKANYGEYTFKTPGVKDRGSRRILLNSNTNEVFYSSDHYRS